jgi:hypothetical protein
MLSKLEHLLDYEHFIASNHQENPEKDGNGVRKLYLIINNLQ